MMGFYYQNDDKRTQRSVLRLYNISFLHGQAVQNALTPPKAMSYRKLFGIYYHGAVDHAPLIYRLISLRSISAELFERYFDRVEDITRKTWNKHMEDLVPNAFLHIQAEDQSHEKESFQRQEKDITKLAKSLPQPTNTIISKEFMIKKSSLWKAHLYRIADYLTPGPGIWWKWKEDGAVEFFDGPTEPEERPEGPVLTHFRSKSLKDVRQDVSRAWDTCLAKPANLPCYKIRDLVQSGLCKTIAKRHVVFIVSPTVNVFIQKYKNASIKFK